MPVLVQGAITELKHNNPVALACLTTKKRNKKVVLKALEELKAEP